jgi:hypothetical protein
MRILRNLGFAFLCVVASSVVHAQSHPATCNAVSTISNPPNDIPVVQKVVTFIGDPNVLASLRGIRYTATMSTNGNKINMTLTRIYPDHLILVTNATGVSEVRIEASPEGAYIQVSGGPKRPFPDAIRDEFLKTVQFDRFYVGQNIGSIKVKVTDAGTEKIGNIEANVLRLDVAGSKVVWYANPLDGTVLRTIAKVQSPTGMVDQVVDYSDWRVCDGLTIPFQRTTTQGTQISQETINSIEFNPNISGQEQQQPIHGLNQQVAPATPSSPTTAAVSQTQIESWDHTKSVDAIDGTTTDEFMIQGNYIDPPARGAEVRPTLAIFCKGPNDVQALLSVGTVVGGSGVYPSRTDEGKPFNSFGIPVGDMKTTSLDVRFGQLKKIVTAKTFRIAVDEYLGGRMTMQFNIPDSTELFASCAKQKKK